MTTPALPPGFELEDDDPAPPPGFELEERRREPRAPTSMGERFATGLMDPIIGAGQIADRFLVNPIRQAISPGATSMEDVVRQRDAEYVAPEGVDWARMGGNVANPLTWAGGGAGSLGKVLPKALVKALPTTAATAVKAGAVQGALAPVEADSGLGEFAAKKAGQAAIGAVAGRVLGGAATPEAKQLGAQGVRLTPGQAAGGIAGDLEQKMTSLPFTGSVIEKARRRAVEDVQGAAIERATGIPGVRSVEAANKAVSDLYEQAVPHLRPNPEGLMEAADAYNRALQNPELTDAHRKILTGLWDQHFARYPELSGRGLKKLDSELGHLGRKYSGHAASPADQTLSDEIYNVMVGLRSGLEKGLPREAAAKLAQANRGFKAMIPINRAASTRADQLATPRALQKAMAKQARTDVTRMRPDYLLDPAVQALSATVPDSGTAGRMGATSIPDLAAGMVGYIPAKLATSAPGRFALSGTSAERDALVQALIAAQRE